MTIKELQDELEYINIDPSYEDGSQRILSGESTYNNSILDKFVVL